MRSVARYYYVDEYYDIIGDYEILLGYNVPKDEAFRIIHDQYYKEYAGGMDEYRYWVIMAEFQALSGILMDNVKNNALRFIDSMDDYLEGEEETLKKIRNIILSPQKEKKFKKPPLYLRSKTKYKEGDILAIKLLKPIFEWGGDKEDEKSIIDFRKSQEYIRGKYLFLYVSRISKHPITQLMPEIDYISEAIISLYDFVAEKIEEFDIDKEYKFMDMIDPPYKHCYFSTRFIALFNASKEELSEWAEISVIGNKRIDNKTIGDKTIIPYEHISNLDQIIRWSFMNKYK
jgi:hypothetical protein